MTASFFRKLRAASSSGIWDGEHISASKDADVQALMQAAFTRYDEVDAGSLVEEDVDLVEPSAGSPTSSTAAINVSTCLGSSSALTVNKPALTVNKPSVSSNIPLSGKARRKAKQKEHYRRNRQAKRQKTKEDVFSHHEARASTVDKYTSASTAVVTDWKIETARVATTGYVGRPEPANEVHSDSLEDLVGPNSKFGFTLIKYIKGKPTPIVSNDDNKYVIGVVAGSPNDEDWDSAMAEASALLEEALQKCNIPDKETNHRRGKYATLRCGVSMGGGQTQPGNLKNRKLDSDLVAELNSKTPFKRLAGFATSIMAMWAPKLYNSYVETLGSLHSYYPHLQRNFTSSVFAASTYNLGPQTATLRHVDYFNLPYGWCAITALGNFDYTKGGHLVLWDLGLVIEFPPGTTILIPSAVVSHSNIKVQPHECRQSFTQYTAGGIFRWVGNRFMKSTDFWLSLEDKEVPIEEAKMKNRWKAGLGMWTKLNELTSLSNIAID